MTKLELSIIIISYNTRQVTLDCLESVARSLGNGNLTYEVIVIDNASTDGSVKTVEDFSKKNPHFKIVINKENVGFGKANNQGAKLARGEYILFLNSDIVVLEDAIEKLYLYLRNESRASFAGGKLLNKNQSPQPSCGPFFSPAIVFGFLFLRGDYWGLTRYSPNTAREVSWVSGACLMGKKSDFEIIGGFDEQIFMYMEEVDLLYRAKKRRLRTFFCPQARFIHLGSASSRGRTFPILQVYRGYLYFYKKHYGRASLLMLKSMLQLKAKIAFLIGRITKNRYLIETYEEAYRVAQKA